MIGKFVRALTMSALLPLTSLAATVDVAAIPGDRILAPGESTFVELVGTYDGSDKILGGAISLNYSADLFEVLGVTLRAPSDVAGATGTVITSGSIGTVSSIGFATFVGVSGTFRLATVELRAIGPVGESILTAFDPGDPIYAWVNESFDVVGVTSSPVSIAVSPVPEPASLALWLAGLASVFRVSSRKRRSPRVKTSVAASSVRPYRMDRGRHWVAAAIGWLG